MHRLPPDPGRRRRSRARSVGYRFATVARLAAGIDRRSLRACGTRIPRRPNHGERWVSYTGFLLNQDTYSVQLLDFNKGLVSIPRTSFEEFTIDNKSLMPSYRDRLTSAELDDIVSYLYSLRREKGTSE